ncbi:hypothetical protein ILUMI_00412 [Ignelater luminosus]|uniref:Uncharacterized protein n=1 Tax=Ignelater luminosus TaxID=2038154 RepID=A0A8K0DMC3_IGNLU|nr:hypothetical protein ILUMI_00412 [Ignelater luminosus]
MDNNQQRPRRPGIRINGQQLYYIPAAGAFESLAQRGTPGQVEFIPLYAVNRQGLINPETTPSSMPNVNTYPTRGRPPRMYYSVAGRGHNNYSDTYRYAESGYHPLGRCPHLQCPLHHVAPPFVNYPTPPNVGGYANSVPQPATQWYRPAAVQPPPAHRSYPFLAYGPAPTTSAGTSNVSQSGATGYANMQREIGEEYLIRNYGATRITPGTGINSESGAAADANGAVYTRPDIPVGGYIDSVMYTIPLNTAQNTRPNTGSEDSRNRNHGSGLSYELLENVANLNTDNRMLVQQLRSSRLPNPNFKGVYATLGSPMRSDSPNVSLRQGTSTATPPPPLPPRSVPMSAASPSTFNAGDLRASFSAPNAADNANFQNTESTDSTDEDSDGANTAAQFNQMTFAYSDPKPRN